MSDPMDDRKSTSDDWSIPGEDEPGGGSTTREWLSQLQSMIDNAATMARPVLREVAAKAAELAAVAGEKAGPIAHKAAEVTAQAGTKVAERGREVAAELRRDGGDDTSDDAIAPIETVEPADTVTTTDAPTPLGDERPTS